MRNTQKLRHTKPVHREPELQCTVSISHTHAITDTHTQQQSTLCLNFQYINNRKRPNIPVYKVFSASMRSSGSLPSCVRRPDADRDTHYTALVVCVHVCRQTSPLSHTLSKHSTTFGQNAQLFGQSLDTKTTCPCGRIDPPSFICVCHMIEIVVGPQPNKQSTTYLPAIGNARKLLETVSIAACSRYWFTNWRMDENTLFTAANERHKVNLNWKRTHHTHKKCI